MVSNAWSLDLELTKGRQTAIPLAIVPFNGEAGLPQISQMIRGDLAYSQFFRFLEHNSAKQPTNALNTDFKYWVSIGANYLIVGDIKKVGARQVSVAFQLLDPVTTPHILLSQEYTINKGNAKALAHHISCL